MNQNNIEKKDLNEKENKENKENKETDKLIDSFISNSPDTNDENIQSKESKEINENKEIKQNQTTHVAPKKQAPQPPPKDPYLSQMTKQEIIKKRSTMSVLESSSLTKQSNETTPKQRTQPITNQQETNLIHSINGTSSTQSSSPARSSTSSHNRSFSFGFFSKETKDQNKENNQSKETKNDDGKIQAPNSALFESFRRKGIDSKARESIYKPNQEVLSHFTDVRVQINNYYYIDGDMFIISKSEKIFIRYAPCSIKQSLEGSIKQFFGLITQETDLTEYAMVCCLNDIKKIKVQPLSDNNRYHEIEIVPTVFLPFEIPKYIFNNENATDLLKVLQKFSFLKRKGNEYQVVTSSLSKRMSTYQTDVFMYMQIINNNERQIEKRKQYEQQKMKEINYDMSKQFISSDYMNQLKGKEISSEKDDEIRRLLLFNKVDESQRWEFWKYCLGVPFDNKEKTQHYHEMFEKLKLLKATIFPEQLRRWSDLKTTFIQIEKDVVRHNYDERYHLWENPKEVVQRLLELYALYNMNIRYVQGMHDLLLGLMELSNNEEDIFWAFDGMMEIVIREFECPKANVFDKRLLPIINFVDEELALYLKEKNISMYFAYQWIVLLFKRDLPPEHVLNVWDSIIAYPKHKLQYFIAAIIIVQQRDHILGNHLLFDEVTMFFQCLSGLFSTDIRIEADLLYNDFMKNASSDAIYDVFSAET